MNIKKYQSSKHGGCKLRIYKNKDGYTVKCGDCDNKLSVVVFNDMLEINGVIADIKEWSDFLMPILRDSKNVSRASLPSRPRKIRKNS